MPKYKTALIVGRFQPFHLGHFYLFKKAFENAEKIVIAIGSSNVRNKNNPISYADRKKMLEKVVEHEGWQDKVIKIAPSPDHPSDDVWFDLLYKNTGHFDVKIGRHDDTTNTAIKEAGFKTLVLPYKNRNFYQGIFIRTLFKEGKNWQDRVPSYLISFIEDKLNKTLSTA